MLFGELKIVVQLHQVCAEIKTLPVLLEILLAQVPEAFAVDLKITDPTITDIFLRKKCHLILIKISIKKLCSMQRVDMNKDRLCNKESCDKFLCL